MSYDSQTFFRLLRQSKLSDSECRFEVELNPEHACYQGHFPGSPVAPGVLLTDMVVDLCSVLLDRRLVLVAARDIKFLAVVNPFETPLLIVTVNLTEENGEVKVGANATWNEQVYFKLNGLLADDK